MWLFNTPSYQPRGARLPQSRFSQLPLSVRIANPLWGGSGYTTPAQAERYVSQGKADWLNDGSIYMHEHNLHSGIRSETRGLGGLARLDELKHVPVLMARKCFTLTSKPRKKHAVRTNQQVARHTAHRATP